MKKEDENSADGKVQEVKEELRKKNEDEKAPKETMEERAKREHWTDVAESHLGIDE